MAYNYMAYTLQVHDYLLELRGLLQPYCSQEPISILIERIDTLNAKLEDMHFQVAVVGEFKRGKTSLINALLRKEILPADVVPTTATINRITYGDVPSSYIYWNNGMPPEKIEIGQLSGYITKLTDRSAAQAKNIREAVVEFPCRFCEHNVDLIDTPGMNDDDLMNSVTIRGLSNIDLAIVVLEPESPVSNTEARFIAHLVENDQICQIIFVLSKIDTVLEEDRDALIAVIKKRVRTCVRDILLDKHTPEDVVKKCDALFSDVVLFPVSARQALFAYEMGNKTALEESGFKRLDEELLPIIIRSQHSAAILTPLRVGQRICAEFQANLEKWKDQASAEQQRQDMKSAFANAAYGFRLNYDEIQVQLTGELSKLKKKHVYEASNALCPLAKQGNSQDLLIGKVKELFQYLSTELPQEEKCFHVYAWARFILPAYADLRKTLTGIIVDVEPEYLPQIEPSLAELTVLSSYSSLVSQLEAFYWERPPIPRADTKPGQIAYAVSSAVEASFDNYYSRREAQLSLLLSNIKSRQEQKITVLVQELFRQFKSSTGTAGNMPPVDRQTYERLTARLKDISKRCGQTERDYLAQSGRKGRTDGK